MSLLRCLYPRLTISPSASRLISNQELRFLVPISQRNKMTTSTTHASATASKEKPKQAPYRPLRPRKFAPLKAGTNAKVGDEALPKLRGIVFDMDGTLCLPQNYMFAEMRAALSIEKPTDILDHIRSLSNIPDDQSNESSSTNTSPPHDPSNPLLPPAEEMISKTSDSNPTPKPSSPQSRAVALIQQIERRAMTNQRPQPGLVELMTYLESRNVPKAMCTRNFPAPVDHLIKTFLGDLKAGFDVVITRDTEGVEPKPSPEGLWKIAQHWGLDREIPDGRDGRIDIAAMMHDHLRSGATAELDPLEIAKWSLGSGMIMVGDSIDDMAAGYRAGAATVLLVNEENEALAEHEYTDLAVKQLDELVSVLEHGFVGRS